MSGEGTTVVVFLAVLANRLDCGVLAAASTAAAKLVAENVAGVV